MLSENQYLKSFSTYVTHTVYECDKIPHTTFRLYLIDFQVLADSPSKLFTVK